MKKFLILVTAIILSAAAPAQQHAGARIEAAMKRQDFRAADSILNSTLQSFIRSGIYDSIPAYTIYVGSVTSKLYNIETGAGKISQFIQKIKMLNPGKKIMARIMGQAADFFGTIGSNDRAYKLNQEARTLAASDQTIEPEFIAVIDSDLGTYAFRKGDIALALYHHRKAINTFLSSPSPDADRLYVAANNMGGQMWMSSKMDSALYYYNIALDALASMEKTPLNAYYRPAVLQNNMAGLYNMQGETQKAIKAMTSCIDNLRTYLSIPENIPKRPGSLMFQFEATDNLGGIYKELGDYTQAYNLEFYSYQQKLKHADEDPSGIFKSQILLGQLFYAMKDYQKAFEYLNTGLENLAKADGDFLYWHADACHTMALLHEAGGNINEAARYYEKADSLYEITMQGSYDDIYLEFLRNASLFYADNQKLALALNKANKGFDYIRQNQGTQTLPAFYQLLNLAEIYFKSGDYNRSMDYSTAGIEVVENRIRNSSTKLDSVKTELKKPKAILMKVKAAYHLEENRDVAWLQKQLQELNEAVGVIERRKTLIGNSKDISLLMSDHMDLLDFIKKITLDLYQLTQDEGYINRIMDLHESGTYTRIRARLDRSDTIRFAHIPPGVQEQEKKLRQHISAALEKEGSHEEIMPAYFRAVEDWNQFQSRLKKEYPHYYRMRYESIFKTLGDIQQQIAAGTTAIRYFFVDKALYAVILDRNEMQLIPLKSDGLDKMIPAVSNFSTPEKELTENLHQLYIRLWMPLEPYIKNQKLVIIPDGILFNLSFEVLTPKKIRDLSQLADESLLARYTMAYHYTLALVGKRNELKNPEGNFIAFAPGFLDDQKKDYMSRIRDSFHLDRSYVNLLPQPFTIDFVQKAKIYLGGTAFTRHSSTANIFRDFAGRHRIIHIGTHAESNNLRPEFSRLIFSKSENSDNNSIYLYELYNCDLRSDLAVLTACESGKPGYQDGEGMISLAHAFNYAGSESIVTGLWKIDEKASTIIMDAFYKNLVKGLDKDEALRQAKLHYLSTAKGRMLAPQYWAGLVLMGDTTPVNLEKKSRNMNWWWMGLTGIIAIAGLALYFRKNRIAA